MAAKAKAQKAGQEMEEHLLEELQWRFAARDYEDEGNTGAATEALELASEALEAAREADKTCEKAWEEFRAAGGTQAHLR